MLIRPNASLNRLLLSSNALCARPLTPSQPAFHTSATSLDSGKPSSKKTVLYDFHVK
jgi:hypothetical protein